MEIKKTNDIKPTSLTALIVGQASVGKTTLASTLDNPLIISCESGLLSLKNFSIDYLEIDSVGALRSALGTAAKSDYVNIYIDSLTEINNLFLNEAKKKYPDDRQTMKMYGELLVTMTSFIRHCRDMKKNIFFTALEKTTQDDFNRRHVMPDLVGSISSKCPAFFDFVFRMQLIVDDDNEKRLLLTSASSDFPAKDRSGKLDKYEPADLGKIIEKIFKGESK